MKTALKITLTGIAALTIYNEFQKRNAKPKVYVSNFVVGKYNAKTLPPFGIFVSEAQKDNQRLIEHELIHWHQYQKEGLINFTRNYLKSNKQFGYDLNPYEIEARILSGEKLECIENYTECVRCGDALTVSNSDFLS